MRQMDITAPEGEVQVQIRADGKVLWIHVEGVTVLRVCRIEGGLKIDDARAEDPKLFTQSEVNEMLRNEYQAGYNDGTLEGVRGND